MTDVLSHEIRRTDWHHKRHTYLVDTGTAIDIPLMEVSKVHEGCILDPPYPKTRYFEIEIDEKRDGTTKTAIFHTIFPVLVKRKPDWRFLIFRIKRGSWTITKRIHFPTDNGEAQWLYTDDFNILFLSSGGRHDLDMLIHLITDKLNTITRSFCAGTSIPSEFENQLLYRTTFNTIFSKGVDGAFRDSAVYRDYGLIESKKTLTDSASLSGKEICSHHGWDTMSAEMAAGLHIDINEIEELRDLSWLC
jgi:hypothetical protein